ncbi:hypothetical protein [Enterobacter mori]|uniref:hypothetical protein n=1 Tax=Enterobacter mori TaxID=539813 RepID=UPI002B1F2433|nr:hypothetical protein [Enterobacter mori]MEA5206366.1 hypothetical protein [Enterobacter mori]
MSNEILERWDFDELSQFGFLFHGVRDPNSVLFTSKAADVFSSWDIFSTSYIDVRYFLKSICPIGLILQVPKQNILGTHPNDVWFPTHLGTARDKKIYRTNAERTGSLTHALTTGVNLRGRLVNQLSEKYRRLMTPQQLSEMQWAMQAPYNEVLVVGRPGVNVYAGLQATRAIRVIGVFSGSNVTSLDDFNRLCRANPGVPKYTGPNDLLRLRRDIRTSHSAFLY